jgi:hypothetical protein
MQSNLSLIPIGTLCLRVHLNRTYVLKLLLPFSELSAKTKIITKISYIVAWFLANINV